jgi:hypothetical protein
MDIRVSGMAKNLKSINFKKDFGVDNGPTAR